MRGDLVAGQRSVLTIALANTGRGPCSDVVFTVGMPPGTVLLGGVGRVVLPVLPAGRTHTYEITLRPRAAGRLDLTGTNFSYRDENDDPVRVTGFRVQLPVRAAPETAPAGPLGRLGVTCETAALPLDAWDQLRILVSNDTGVPVREVTAAVTGPFTGDVPRSRIPVLEPGKRARFTFQVRPDEAGPHVPVTVRTAYTHRGSIGTQEDHLTVTVRPSPASAPERQTVLYLAANPRGLPPLRSDDEMRRVKERLQLSRHRGEYRIEAALAVRFDDISQSLVDHEPEIVHFSGHGDPDGSLHVEDARGRSTTITPEGLAALFGLHSKTLRCVILNACYSERLARQLVPHVGHVVGMSDAIGDQAALEFSVGFYLSLFDGRSVPDSFARGRAHLLSRPGLVAEHQTPVLFPAP